MWQAIEVEAEGVPLRYCWVVEFEDDEGNERTVCTSADCWLGLTKQDAENLAAVLNGYIDREEIEAATLAPTPKKEWSN